MPTLLRKREHSEYFNACFVCKSYISIKMRNFGTTFETYLLSERIHNCKGVL